MPDDVSENDPQRTVDLHAEGRCGGFILCARCEPDDPQQPLAADHRVTWENPPEFPGHEGHKIRPYFSECDHSYPEEPAAIDLTSAWDAYEAALEAWEESHCPIGEDGDMFGCAETWEGYGCRTCWEADESGDEPPMLDETTAKAGGGAWSNDPQRTVADGPATAPGAAYRTRPGYDTCDECKGFNPAWFTDDATWRKHVPEDKGMGAHGLGTVLCPRCFAARVGFDTGREVRENGGDGEDQVYEAVCAALAAFAATRTNDDASQTPDASVKTGYQHPEGSCGSIQCARCFPELGRARVRFWTCPEHLGAPHRVEWHGDVAHCLTCGRTSTPETGQQP